MGVQGLTTYVSRKSDIYFVDFQLKDCFLIIDGYGLASSLYNNSTKINSSFGGDYDKYAKNIIKYFEILRKCSVTPIVICDGGYEKKKVNTIKRRTLKRIFSFEKINPSCANQQCFPLMMRHVFRETVLNQNVTLLQSDFEADNEIAALAKKLNAPVLSNDSDFFIFDVQYIPLSSMPFDSFEKTNKGHFYIPCQIFQLDNLLNGLGGLTKTMLPLLATVLGNDYIKSSQFKSFYDHLKMDKSKKTKPGEKRVKGLVSWLREEDFDSALHKILKCLKKNVRRNVRRNINEVIKGYTNLNTPLDSYLPDDITCKFQNEVDDANLVKEFCRLTVSENSNSDSELDEEDVCIENDKENSDNGGSFDECDGDSDLLSFSEDEDDDCTLLEKPNRTNLFPPWLLDESRKGNVCSSISTLLSLKTYFYSPQVEDYEYPHAGIVTLPILQLIAGLLSLDEASYWARQRSRYIKTQLHPLRSNTEFICPPFSELNQLTTLERKQIILKTLHVENKLLLESFPLEWQLYVGSIVYWIKSNNGPIIRPWHIHAVLMTLITVNVINKKIGMFWQKKTFMNRYASKLRDLAKLKAEKNNSLVLTPLSDALNAVSGDDCIIAMEFLIPYFHVDERLNRQSRNFSRTTIHLFAQLQSIFDLATTLNSLILMPYKRSNLSMFYNGTFLYNFAANFKTRTNIESYIDNLFGKVPSIRILYRTLFETFSSLIPSAPKQKIKTRKSKHKKGPVQKVDKISECTDDEEYLDSNNKFSLLLKV